MNAAAPTPDLPNPTTAAVRLLAALRWFALLLLINWLIICGRRLTAVLRQGTRHPRFPLFVKRFGTDDCAVIRDRIASGLRRARALEDELIATGPADQRLADLAHCRAIGARILDIGREIGVFRDAPARIIRRDNAARHRNRALRGWFPLTLGRPATAAPATCVQPSATGPPALRPHHIDADTDAGVPWNFSRRTPASFSLYALS